jgi:flagellar hook-associated protein 1
MSIQQTAISGLLSAQRGLTVVSHNISNVNTPGYSRQQVELGTRDASLVGNGFIGNGVEINSIVRAHDLFITNQLRSSISGESEASSFLFLASRIDSMLANEETGLTISLQNFFNSVQDVTDQPSSIAARQVMISEAESLASRFQFLDARMSDLSTEIRTQLGNNVRDVNSLTSGIAELNNQIVKSLGQSDGQPPNDLLDQRDKLIEDLSQLVGVNVVEQGDGSVNIFVGNGQPLVLGANSSQISASESYSGHFAISLTNAFGSSDITDFIKGGSMGGTLDFQNQMLEPARNSLGRLALGFADSFNTQHALGQSLDGDINQSFFNMGVPDVLPLGAAPNNVTAAITDTTALSNSDYSLVYNGGNIYTLTRNTDGQTTSINTGGAPVFVTAPVDGFSMTITAGAAVNDKFIIRPSINGAGDISTTISDPRKIAAAAALRSSFATDSAGVPLNSGNAAITEVEISSTTGLPLGTAVTLTFDSALNQFNVSAPPGGTLAYNPATESGGKQFSLATIGNATFSISGNPADGDQFVIENNTNASGDNQNGLKLSSLQTTTTLLGGTASYQDSYGQMVAEVGTTTRQTQISSEALATLRNQALTARDSISGVNLEEEAANMLKFQQAFQAAAQMVSMADRLFQTLMQAVQ